MLPVLLPATTDSPVSHLSDLQERQKLALQAAWAIKQWSLVWGDFTVASEDVAEARAVAARYSKPLEPYSGPLSGAEHSLLLQALRVEPYRGQAGWVSQADVVLLREVDRRLRLWEEEEGAGELEKAGEEVAGELEKAGEEGAGSWRDWVPWTLQVGGGCVCCAHVLPVCCAHVLPACWALPAACVRCPCAACTTQHATPLHTARPGIAQHALVSHSTPWYHTARPDTTLTSTHLPLPPAPCRTRRC
jgi:hypothetical protein